MPVEPALLWEAPFKEIFCRARAVGPGEYEQKVFWRCLHRHALPFAYLLLRFDPDFFREDFYLIQEVGGVRDPKLFTQELNYFHGRNRRERGWLRGSFAIRISAKRLIRLKNRVFRQEALRKERENDKKSRSD